MIYVLLIINLLIHDIKDVDMDIYFKRITKRAYFYLIGNEMEIIDVYKRYRYEAIQDWIGFLL